jgi:tetraprenyl-beta-curcumene synthase
MGDRRPARALAAVVVRYLATIQPHASRELAGWRRRALAIPNPQLRAHVVHPFVVDRSAAGAALFAALAPWRHQLVLVRLLIAYVLLWSYVDVRSESESDADPRLYDALVDALGGTAASELTLADDAGYLAGLLATCRYASSALPSWNVVAPVAIELAAAGRAVQRINHGPPLAAAIRLRRWAAADAGAAWQEACAAASSPLAINALMALAAHPCVERDAARAIAAAYGPVSALGVLCDHLIDRTEDEIARAHSYLRHLGLIDARAAVLHELADRASQSVRQLHDGERHVVILSAMAAMFLSRGRPTAAVDAATASAILHAIGPPAPQLRTALRAAHICPSRAR